MGTRYIKEWDELVVAVQEGDEQVEEAEDLVFQVDGYELTCTVTDLSKMRSASSLDVP